jgi:SagB-type dehydrogenase family enzyme
LTVSFDLLPDHVIEQNGRVSITRTRRTVYADLDASLVPLLLDGLSSGGTLASLVADVPGPAADDVHDVVADLVGWGALVSDADARPRVAHAWSMRGAQGRGRLSPQKTAELTFTPRTYGDDGPTVVTLPAVRRPFPVDSLSTVLRRRRSPTKYDGSSISLDQLAQLLGGACGVTGELVIDGRAVLLRAYPSPGALYGVDVHVVPARVDGLVAGAFRYDPVRHRLAMVGDRAAEPASFCLPDVRTVAEGAAVFLALTICLPRATPKYGDESYRILVAEAGCVAENLVLVAHALGLRAGPFTGVFDGLVDRALGLDPPDTSFVVGVLVGRDERTP